MTFMRTTQKSYSLRRQALIETHSDSQDLERSPYTDIKAYQAQQGNNTEDTHAEEEDSGSTQDPPRPSPLPPVSPFPSKGTDEPRSAQVYSAAASFWRQQTAIQMPNRTRPVFGLFGLQS